MFSHERTDCILQFLGTYPSCWQEGLRVPLPHPTHCFTLEQQISWAGHLQSFWVLPVKHPPSLCLPVTVPVGSEKQRSEVRVLLGLFPHLHCFLTEPRQHCPNPRTCLESKEKQNKTSRERYQVMLQGKWILVWLDVCKRAEKTVLTEEQGCAV